jgi:septal ring factor EnvC (AmiA/AmiB activator)
MGFALVKCPNCEAEVSQPTKSWPVTFKKPSEMNAQAQFSVGVFDCPNCKSKFRARVQTTASTTPSQTNVAVLVERINTIRDGLSQTLKALQLKIRTLETERASLLNEAEELRRTAEQRASALEAEVGQLRREIKSMRELLDPAANEAV